jgi:hypothetical protein
VSADLADVVELVDLERRAIRDRLTLEGTGVVSVALPALVDAEVVFACCTRAHVEHRTRLREEDVQLVGEGDEERETHPVAVERFPAEVALVVQPVAVLLLLLEVTLAGVAARLLGRRDLRKAQKSAQKKEGKKRGRADEQGR